MHARKLAEPEAQGPLGGQPVINSPRLAVMPADGPCGRDRLVSRFRPTSPDALSEKDLYTMILNWHPNAERTSNGFFKNLSLKQGEDRRSSVTVKDLGL